MAYASLLESTVRSIAQIAIVRPAQRQSLNRQASRCVDIFIAQPYLLQLFGDKQAIGIAGIAAAGIARTQIAGGLRHALHHKTVSTSHGHRIACALLTVLSFDSMVNS
jgi:hypothetical protein